jgi:hypothetical protein
MSTEKPIEALPPKPPDKETPTALGKSGTGHVLCPECGKLVPLSKKSCPSCGHKGLGAATKDRRVSPMRLLLAVPMFALFMLGATCLMLISMPLWFIPVIGWAAAIALWKGYLSLWNSPFQLKLLRRFK